MGSVGRMTACMGGLSTGMGRWATEKRIVSMSGMEMLSSCLLSLAGYCAGRTRLHYTRPCHACILLFPGLPAPGRWPVGVWEDLATCVAQGTAQHSAALHRTHATLTPSLCAPHRTAARGNGVSTSSISTTGRAEGPGSTSTGPSNTHSTHIVAQHINIITTAGIKPQETSTRQLPSPSPPRPVSKRPARGRGSTGEPSSETRRLLPIAPSS